MDVGRIRIDPVIDGAIHSRIPSATGYPDPGSDRWRELHGMVGHGGLMESTHGGFVVRTGDRVLLVDAGCGPEVAGGYTAPVIDADDPTDVIGAVLRRRGATTEMVRGAADSFGRIRMTRGWLPAALAALGIEPSQVTDVVFTHLHFDHIGWAAVDGEAWFPNAVVRCAAADLDHFLSDPVEEDITALVYRTLRARERLEPLLDRLQTWEADRSLAAGVDVRLAPGHTPGSSVVVLSDGEERALLLGDMVHCPLELTDDDFNLLADHDQPLANRTRAAWARELEATGVPAAAAHFPGLRFGRLLATETARRWVF